LETVISGLQFLQHQGQFDADALSKMFIYYLALLVLDLGSAALAFKLERREEVTVARGWYCSASAIGN
jgi:peptidoglycan-N-acetylglucosamine deacetylase